MISCGQFPAHLAVVLVIVAGCAEEVAEGNVDADGGDTTVVELVDAVADTSPPLDTDDTATEAASEIAGEVPDSHQDGSCRPASPPKPVGRFYSSSS